MLVCNCPLTINITSNNFIMSGELQIVFIYDTLYCQNEEDDPKDAILYFHPDQISEDRRVAICGNIIGITRFLTLSFSVPKILTLDNGKFAIRSFDDQYVLALCCSNLTPDRLLEQQVEILYSLTRFFHNDIKSLMSLVDGNHAKLMSKLSTIIDYYIPISQHHGDLFSLNFEKIPILFLPKSANNITLQSSILLQSCILKKGVLGGLVCYQNKVVGVEILHPDLVQKLSYIQPYHLPPADSVKLEFKLPPGVQFFKIFISRSELRKIRTLSSSYQNPSSVYNDPSNFFKDERKPSSINIIREEEPSDISSSIGFSEISSPYNTTTDISELETKLEKLKILTEQKRQSFLTSSASILPCQHLNLEILPKNHSTHSHSSSNSNCKSFIRRSKSEETLSDIQKLKAKAPSDENLKQESLRKENRQSLADPFFPFVRCDGRCISNALLSSTLLNQSPEEINLSPSTEIIQKISDKKTIDANINKQKPPKKSNFGLENLIVKTSDSSQPQATSFTNLISSNSNIKRPNDLPLNSLNLNNNNSKGKSRSRRWSTFDDLLSPVTNLSLSNTFAMTNMSNNANEVQRRFSDLDSSHFNNRKFLENSFRRVSTSKDRDDTEEEEDEISSFYSSTSSNSSSSWLSHSGPKNSSGKSSKGKMSFSLKDSSTQTQKDKDPLDASALLIINIGSARLMIIYDIAQLEAFNRDFIETLYEFALSSLPEIEMGVSEVEGDSSLSIGQSEPYCYLRYEPIWKSLTYSGRNHSMDFPVIQLMHQDFVSNPGISELIIRGDDHVVYGYQCVGSEVYYQQGATPQPGLPQPSDIIGKVPLKAKRRLERDYNILLL